MKQRTTVLERVLREAGTLLLEGFRKEAVAFEEKGTANLVTSYDLASEQVIRRLLHEAFPGEPVIGEEEGGTGHSADRVWIVDPLDGTTNFVHRYPRFAVSIACVEQGRPLAGGVYAPANDVLYMAELGAGSLRNGKPVTVSTVPDLEHAILVTGFAYERQQQVEQILELVERALYQVQAVRRSGSAALDLCTVAEGSFDVYLEWGIHAWDIAAGVLLVQEAGGQVSNARGSAIDLFGRDILASNGLLHAAAIKHLVKGET